MGDLPNSDIRASLSSGESFPFLVTEIGCGNVLSVLSSVFLSKFRPPNPNGGLR